MRARLPDPWLVRTRLNERCGKVKPGEAMLVAAFAGSGKTTLLADWFTNNCPVANRAWLTIEAHDNAPGRLSSLLARASERAKRLPTSTAGCVPTCWCWTAVRAHGHAGRADGGRARRRARARPASGARRAFTPARRPTADVDCVPRRPGRSAAVVPRMQVEGRLHQIRAADLTLTLGEMAELFERHDLQVSESDVALLHDRTGGWAAGARLAALALVARP